MATKKKARSYSDLTDGGSSLKPNSRYNTTFDKKSGTFNNPWKTPSRGSSVTSALSRDRQSSAASPASRLQTAKILGSSLSKAMPSFKGNAQPVKRKSSNSGFVKAFTDKMGEIIKSKQAQQMGLAGGNQSNMPVGAAGILAQLLGGGGAGSAFPAAGGSGSLPQFGKTLQDYLDAAGDGSNLAAPLLNDIDARGNALRGRASEGEAAIGKAYKYVEDSLGKAATAAEKQYADSMATAESNTQAANDQIKAARASSGAETDAIKANLGIEGKSSAENYAAQDQADAAARNIAGGLTQKEYMQNLGNSAQDFYRQNQSAAGFRGAESKAALNRDLLDRLGILDSEKAGVKADAMIQAQQMAQQKYAADYGAFTDNRNFQASQDDSAYNRSVQQWQMEQQQRQAAAGAYSDQQQQDFDNSITMGRLGLDTQKFQADQQANQAASLGSGGMAALNGLMSQVKSGNATDISGVILKALNSDQPRVSVEDFTRIGMTPQDAVRAAITAQDMFKQYK